MKDSTSQAVTLRLAVADDVPEIICLLADDPLGQQREAVVTPLPPSYAEAFAAIDKDPNQQLLVAQVGDEVVGVLQLTFVPSLTYQGAWRALVEGVRVATHHRSSGIGRLMFDWVVERARQHGCRMIQLTTDKRRPEAIRFYEALGFVASHEGMKLHVR